MKYIIRFIAAIPMMAAMIIFFVMFFMAFEYPLLIIAVIPQGFAAFICVENYELTVRHLSVFIKMMAEDALNDPEHYVNKL